ncbi:ribosome biogenesis GTPase YlqF [Mycoplasmopsis ciconiae]|uniref:Ribosome biogenesis GTPase A n=2 Tax=Mycoplasmopsis ciconiae TaxID=561067 RepID=A0ABU7MM75_9BACT|nr:ribosome biogenesis GTPase YlqF [Mycoplasmopsis ciconiae]
MAKATKEIKQMATLCDVFIVVLDARCPISSYNEDFDLISPNKPRLFVITKSDLMDASKKERINKRFGSSNILWLDLRKAKSRNLILNKLKSLMKDKIQKNREKGIINTKIKSFVLGVPNAGKSTLINLMAQNSKLKVADYPGVTRNVQWVNVDNTYLFLDTPGILLPKFDDQEVAVKLATIGSIKTDIFPLFFMAKNIYLLISKYYPDKIEQLGTLACEDEVQAYNQLVTLAINKNFKINNKPDLNKVCAWFINWAKKLTGVTYD